MFIAMLHASLWGVAMGVQLRKDQLAACGDSRMVTVAFTEDSCFVFLNNRDMILIRAQEKKMSGKEVVAGTQLELRRSHGKMPRES